MNQHQSFYQEYIKQLHKHYPSTASKNLALPAISPFVINITQNIVDQISGIVKICYKMAHLKKYEQIIQTNKNVYLNTTASDSSVLMSYDFHLDFENNLKLIEVNTNASGYLISELVSKVHQKNLQNISSNTQEVLKKSFENEWEYYAGKHKPISRILIADHQIKDQKMYIEFLMYKELFNTWGWACDLHEIKDLNINTQGILVDSHKKQVSMIYNRCTDFYFDDLPYLKKSFINKTCCISPHPREYLLLADKNRLCEWSSADFLDALNLSAEDTQYIKKIVPFTTSVNSFSASELWKKRKQFFFKPNNGYGGKSVYRGKNISHNMFDRVIKELGIVQKLIPPSVFIDASNTKWKYDLRAYVYKDKVQKIIARVYQGQVTQFKTPLSGMAFVNVL